MIAWPHVEAEMALFLGQVLGTGNAATLAVFQILRRSAAQRDAISEAARASLHTTDQELVSALLNAHKSIEAERNALAHGHFGVSSTVPDGFIWMNTADYIDFRVLLDTKGADPYDHETKRQILGRVWVYREPDLVTIFNDVIWLSEIWTNAIAYLRLPVGSKERADKYRQLSGQQRIAQELVKLRQKNTPATPAPPPPPTGGG